MSDEKIEKASVAEMAASEATKRRRIQALKIAAMSRNHTIESFLF